MPKKNLSPPSPNGVPQEYPFESSGFNMHFQFTHKNITKSNALNSRNAAFTVTGKIHHFFVKNSFSLIDFSFMHSIIQTPSGHILL